MSTLNTAFDESGDIVKTHEFPVPFQVSANTLDMMDTAIRNMKAGIVSEAIDLSKVDPEPGPKSSGHRI